MFHFLAALAACLLASLAANRSTPRAHRRLNPPLGWLLTLGFAALAVIALDRQWGLAVAIAVTLAGLMVGIPVVSGWIGWRQRKDQPTRGAHHGT